MKSSTVDYGIDLGTTNSAISRMEGGNPVSIRTNTLKDTMPSCVFINRRNAIQVGDAAFIALKIEKLGAMKNWDHSKDNSFTEFKRTMGSDAVYHSANASRSFSSIELSSEVLKTIKSFEKNGNINSVIITVPAAFKNNQIDATRTAGKEAGFDQIGIITEPEAAAWGYGINGENKDGFWLVFDFGGGTFDAALLKVTDGIRQVVDTEGDNYLGGKNLDEAIVDEIIVPYLQDNFVIDELLRDNNKANILRNAMKFYAEEIKKELSYSPEQEASILTDIGEIPGEDDEGEELELDITVTEAEVEKAVGPIFQKAIDISIGLLDRNNLNGSNLSALILVGGPTYSPILRKMLTKQICKPDTSVDPMTVVAKGAAIYASTVKKNESTIVMDTSKIQLEIDYESTSIEDEEYITIRISDKNTEDPIPDKVFAGISRADGGWSSGKIEINTIGDVILVQLEKGKLNTFKVSLYDIKGGLLESEPSSFNVLGTGKGGSAVLPYNIGIEIRNINSNRLEFRTVDGLEKTKQLPAVGTMTNLKTPKQIRPGMQEDFLEIPIYQGGHNCERSRAIHNHHVNTILITGNDLPSLLPENSDVEIELNIDINQKITGLATFPFIAYTYEFECETKEDSVNDSKADYLDNEIRKAKVDINNQKSKGLSSDDLTKSEKEIEEIDTHFRKNKNAPDTQQQTIENLRKSLLVVDKLIGDREWPDLERELKAAFHNLEEVNRKKGNEETTRMVENMNRDVDQAIREKDKKNTPQLIKIIGLAAFELERLENLIGFVNHLEINFESIPWRDKNAAHQSINSSKSIIYENPSIAGLQPIVNDLYHNGRFGETTNTTDSNVADGILRG